MADRPENNSMESGSDWVELYLNLLTTLLDEWLSEADAEAYDDL